MQEDAFNPAIPADFKLLTEGQGSEAQSQPGKPIDPVGAAHTNKRKSTRSEKQSGGSRSRQKSKTTKWQQMKQKLDAKLGGLDKEKLKTVLVACGIAASVVGAVILAVKMVPIAVLLLALLGLAVVIRIWDRLRRGPDPSY